MARILAISSQVVSGHVGLSAMVPALLRLGHEVLALPTILLSNHPGKLAATGTRVATDHLGSIIDTLDKNGRLEGIDAVLTGYLPSPGHVEVAAKAIRHCRMANADVTVLCDPVIGDDPKGLYIDPKAAAAIRDDLLPYASITTPNRFELAWLTGETVIDAETAAKAAHKLKPPIVVATSVPKTNDRLATLAVTTDHIFETSVALRASVPNGTGDLLAALFVSEYLAANDGVGTALQAAVAAVDRVLDASVGCDELNLVTDWRAVSSA